MIRLVERTPINPFALIVDWSASSNASDESRPNPATIELPQPTESERETIRRQHRHSPKTIDYAREMFERVQRGEFRRDRGDK